MGVFGPSWGFVGPIVGRACKRRISLPESRVSNETQGARFI
jgi:hypothetical protein